MNKQVNSAAVLRELSAMQPEQVETKGLDKGYLIAIGYAIGAAAVLTILYLSGAINQL